MKTKYTTICSREKLADIRKFLSSVLIDLRIADPVKNEIILAVDEACANAMIHGNQCDENKTLQLEIELDENRLVVEISDVGDTSFTDIHHEEKTIENLIQQRKKGGLGLKLIYSIMDEVTYYSSGTRNICSLTKRLK